jgi:hypothetical protein
LVSDGVNEGSITKDYKLTLPLARENDDLVRVVNIAMKGITNDISNDFQFNTVISKYRELTNAIYEWKGKIKSELSEEQLKEMEAREVRKAEKKARHKAKRLAKKEAWKAKKEAEKEKDPSL